MVCSNRLKKILFIFMIILVISFPFFCIAGHCSENIDISSGNYFANAEYQLEYQSNAHGYYFPVVLGHTYTINYKIYDSYDYLRIMFCDDVPSDGVNITEFSRLSPDSSSYTFTCSNAGYLYFYCYAYVNFDLECIDITNNYSNTIDSLVENVGVTQIWDIFDISVDFILIVVLVAFGLFIILKIIKRVSKGKQGF